MPEKTREAAKLVFESGWSYESASRKTGVSSKRISLAARKLTAMDALLLQAYRLSKPADHLFLKKRTKTISDDL